MSEAEIPMHSSDFLLTIAEVSVALAGFSGVVVGLRGRRATIDVDQNRFGLYHLLATSVGATLFSLLPFALVAAGMGRPTAWTTTTLLLGSTTFVASVSWGRAGLRVRPRYPSVFWSLISLGMVLGLVLLATGSHVVETKGSLVEITLVFLLVVGFVQFVIFLLDPALPESDAAE
jgi:hypothetical protein